jgi:hypothetical protein
MGFLLVVLVSGANADDGTTAPRALRRLTPEYLKRLEKLLPNGNFHNNSFESDLRGRRSTWRFRNAILTLRMIYGESAQNHSHVRVFFCGVG